MAIKNVDIELTDDEIIIRIDRNENFGPSGSGKSDIVATTGGSVEVEEGSNLYLGLNCFIPHKKLRRRED